MGPKGNKLATGLNPPTKGESQQERARTGLEGVEERVQKLALRKTPTYQTL